MDLKKIFSDWSVGFKLSMDVVGLIEINLHFSILGLFIRLFQLLKISLRLSCAVI